MADLVIKAKDRSITRLHGEEAVKELDRVTNGNVTPMLINAMSNGIPMVAEDGKEYTID